MSVYIYIYIYISIGFHILFWFCIRLFFVECMCVGFISLLVCICLFSCFLYMCMSVSIYLDFSILESVIYLNLYSLVSHFPHVVKMTMHECAFLFKYIPNLLKTIMCSLLQKTFLSY